MEATLQKKVTIRLDDARFNELLDCSRREGFSVSTIVRHLVYRYVEQQRKFAGMVESPGHAAGPFRVTG